MRPSPTPRKFPRPRKIPSSAAWLKTPQPQVLLVPTTEVLLTARDRDTNASYADLSGSEEFLASHVLRVPGGIGPNNHVKDGPTFKESRGKAKQYSTANGRTVIIKDAFVYSNKGFKTLNQAQLLADIIYYPDTFEPQPWLVYFISRPLIGTYDATPILPARIPEPTRVHAPKHPSTAPSSSGSSVSMPRKKDVKSFGDLLNHFPMIARQMQPGLDRLFTEFKKELEKPLPPTPGASSRASSLSSRRRASVSSAESAPLSLHGNIYGPNGFISTLEIDDDEDLMRRSLETAVIAAIDLFQGVDKQQLSLLGATTDLTGPLVERMIEKYITEQLHSLIFPRLQHVRKADDTELEMRMRQMTDIDISQVGIEFGHGRRGKQELSVRLSKAVDIFKRMGVAGSPQEMVEILLSVQKHITMPEAPASSEHVQGKSSLIGERYSEKNDHLLTINADTLVSLLLIVVIRSPIKNLQARLSYMRHFIFIDDVDSGELGYALSTFEAVLSYLARDSGGLRKASRRNKALWQASKTGDLATLQGILEPERSFHEDAWMDLDDDERVREDTRPLRFAPSSSEMLELTESTTKDDSVTTYKPGRLSRLRHKEEDGPLAHIFPFQRAPTPPPSDLRDLPDPPDRPKTKKRVSMDTRSMSSSSAVSFQSCTTIGSRGTGLEGDTSIEKLSKTQGTDGESVLMMAIDNKQEKALQYLLNLTEFYPPVFVLEDCNNDGTTLLSAAVQLGDVKTTDVLLDSIFQSRHTEEVLKAYMAKQDSKGRCVAHYLFHQPRLIDRIGHLVPWRLKDKNGQTPVFAFCRSYDHDQYYDMIDRAIHAATQAQHDNQPLHLDEHIDSKGNSLLHIIADPQIAVKLLYRCDSDVNAPNDKQFTPLMVASKYGRTELVRVLFQDPRIDFFAKDNRGLTAVELAKDDEVRNRIDDMVLLSHEPGPDGRTTTVVRSFFVEDGTIRLVIKSGAPNPNDTVTVTTCRRSLQDFESLAKWLAQEHPASWLPVINNFASPFLIPSRPSRSVLRDIQLRLDAFLRILLKHPTFATHEMVWEFFLVPDIDPAMLAERSARKAELRAERVREEYMPVYDVREVELFVQHARESVRSVHHASRSVLRRTNKLRTTSADLADAAKLASTAIQTLNFLPDRHLKAVERFTKTLALSEASPITSFYYNMHAISSTIAAILAALNRPSTLIANMSSTQKAVDRHSLSMRRSDRWPLGLLDDARSRMQRDAQEKMERASDELSSLGKELRYTQQVVAQELASWQENRVDMGRRALKEFAKRMVVTERARLESMRRAVRELNVQALKSNVVTNCAAVGEVEEVMEEITFDAGVQARRNSIEDVTDEVNGALAMDGDGDANAINGSFGAEEDEALLPPASPVPMSEETNIVGERESSSLQSIERAAGE